MLDVVGVVVDVMMDAVGVWPLTVCATRYQGVYEGGRFVAFNLFAQDVPEQVFGDDVECADFFWGDSRVVFGVGDCLDDAVADLVGRLDL